MKTLENPQQLPLQPVELSWNHENTIKNPKNFHYSLLNYHWNYENTLENRNNFHYSLSKFHEPRKVTESIQVRSMVSLGHLPLPLASWMKESSKTSSKADCKLWRWDGGTFENISPRVLNRSGSRHDCFPRPQRRLAGFSRVFIL